MIVAKVTNTGRANSVKNPQEPPPETEIYPDDSISVKDVEVRCRICKGHPRMTRLSKSVLDDLHLAQTWYTYACVTCETELQVSVPHRHGARGPWYSAETAPLKAVQILSSGAPLEVTAWNDLCDGSRLYIYGDPSRNSPAAISVLAARAEASQDCRATA